MNILSYNPGHDGAFAYLEDAHLVASIEAEKHSHYRHSPLSVPDVFSVLGELNEVPDVLCRGGSWPSDTAHGSRIKVVIVAATGFHDKR
jgi:predicted NodU family carbamoyl transferase